MQRHFRWQLKMTMFVVLVVHCWIGEMMLAVESAVR